MATQPPVTVEHGGLTVTTNMATSEADLLQQLDAPEPEKPAAEQSAAEAAPAPNEPRRDEKGRFARAEAATPPAELPEPAATEPTPDANARAQNQQRSWHDRINKLTQQKAEADRRAQAAEAALALIQQRATPPSQTPTAPTYSVMGVANNEPQFEQFAQFPDPYTAYLQAWARWDHARQLDDRFAAYESQQTRKSRLSTFEQRVAEGRKAHPDLDQLLTDADTLGLQVSGVMQDTIGDSPH